MALACPRCGRQYDVTLFAYGRSVRCECGLELSLEGGTTRYEGDEHPGGREPPPG